MAANCVGKHGESKYYCAECKKLLCDVCCENWHRNIFSDHSLMDSKFVLELDRELSFVPTEEDFQEDEQHNLFVCFTLDYENGAKLSFQRKYFTLDVQEDAILPVVSFVGGTGAGKSRIMRFLVKEGHPKPLPGPPHDTESTSADIHAYLGYLAPHTCLMYDSEGYNGTLPKAARFRFSREAAEEARRGVVKKVYPRLLYMFSDVVCYVTTLSKREQHTLIEQLTVYGGLAAAATVNHSRLPMLILVFNKSSQYEGKWNVEEASRDFSKLEELKLYFRDVRVVDIPDMSYFSQFLDQIAKLKEEIAKGFQFAITNRPRTKKTLYQFLQLAVAKFNVDPESPIDFVDLLFHTLPLPDQYAGFLVAFFEHAYHRVKEVSNSHQAFTFARQMLSSRLSHTFRHHLTRMHGPDEVKNLPQALIKVLDAVETHILQYQPCEAKRLFGGETVTCEVIKEFHEGSHQSSSTHKVDKPVWLLGWLGVHKTIDVACRWDGPHIASAAGHVPLSEEVNKAMQQGLFVSLAFSRALFPSDIADAVYHSPSRRVCLGCLLQVPTEQLQCGHLLCSLCCEEQTPSNSTIHCPLCNTQCLWDHPTLPEGAGYRILSLDAGGVRGVVTALILAQIENNLGIPIHHLFDLVVGSGSGGIIALGIGEQKRMEDIVALFHILSQKAFVPVSRLGTNFAQLLLCHKYRFAPLHETLSKHFTRRPLLGISYPRVSVVGCIPFLNPKICLFSSYHSAHRAYTQQLQGTVLDVAEVFGSGTFYPILGLESICAVDGAIAASSPSTVACDEAHNVWPERSMEIIVNVGVGTWTEADKKAGSDTMTFAWNQVSALKMAVNDWATLMKKIPPNVTDSGSAIRVDATLSQPYFMDGHKHIYQIAADAKSYIEAKKAEIDTVSNKLLAKLFYIPKVYPIVDENGFIAHIEVRRNVPQLRHDNAFFSVRLFSGGKSLAVLSTCTWNGEKLKLAVERHNIPLRGVINVFVFCHIGYTGERIDPGFIISGCPFVCQI